MSSNECDRQLVAANIEGRHGGLRPLTVADARSLYSLSHGDTAASTWREMKTGPFPTEALFAAHVEELIADPSRAFFAVMNAEGAVVGWLCLMEAKPAHQVVEVGYILFTPAMQRTTLATEGLYLLLRHVFDGLGYHRLEWTCTAENVRSRSAADRLGFAFEGILRERLAIKDTRRDICMYAMLSTEWQFNRKVLEAWLNHGNFEGGNQVQSVRALRRHFLEIA